jgi:hypothetical protein
LTNSGFIIVKAAAAAAGPVRKDRRDVEFDKQSIWKNTSVAHILYRGRVKRIILPFCFLIISGLAALSQPVQRGPQVLAQSGFDAPGMLPEAGQAGLVFASVVAV